MTKAEVATALRDFFEEASKAQTLGEWDSVFLRYVKRLSEKESSGQAEIIAEYAAKLRLADDGKEQ